MDRQTSVEEEAWPIRAPKETVGSESNAKAVMI